jgi:hypothetical protein
MDSTLSPTPNWRAALRPLTTARGYLVLSHHLAGLPLGILYFVWFVTGLSLGAGLLVTLLGIPILTGVLASVRPLVQLERALANALLGTRLPAAPLAPAGRGVLGRLRAYWTDAPTWRGLLYLLLRFPLGTFTFCVAVTWYGAALHCLSAPVVMPFLALDIGIWEIDTVLEGLALVPLGLLLLVAAAWVSEYLGAISRAVARWGAR